MKMYGINRYRTRLGLSLVGYTATVYECIGAPLKGSGPGRLLQGADI